MPHRWFCRHGIVLLKQESPVLPHQQTYPAAESKSAWPQADLKCQQFADCGSGNFQVPFKILARGERDAPGSSSPHDRQAVRILAVAAGPLAQFGNVGAGLVVYFSARDRNRVSPGTQHCGAYPRAPGRPKDLGERDGHHDPADNHSDHSARWRRRILRPRSLVLERQRPRIR